jgi:alkylation response protein AidB-like acyl-CoA dehydrogenase
MQPTWGPEAEGFREKIQAFLAEHLPADWKGIGALPAEEVHDWTERWRRTLADNQLLAPRWPAEYGGPGLTETETVIMAEEFARAGVPTGGPNDVFGIQMVGNTILQWGSEEQKRAFIPKILSGEHRWCQGYSEPNAGSDLGNLGCRAVLDGDEWVINGQKIWTSAGHLANWIFVLARTDPDAPKHRGISYLVVDMTQPGIEVRPLRQITGEAEFNEVFLDDVFVPEDQLVGGLHEGWAVANTTLAHERGTSFPFKEQVVHEVYLDELVREAAQRGALDDPLTADRLAQAFVDLRVLRLHNWRTLSRLGRGEQPGPESSWIKLAWTDMTQHLSRAALDVLGSDAPRWPSPDGTVSAGTWQRQWLWSKAASIAGGTSEVQRTVIGERILGLPRG